MSGTDSTSHKNVLKVSSVNILSVDIARNARYTDFINDSHEPLIHGLWGRLNFHVMFLEFKCCVILLRSRSFSNALSSYLPAIKLLPMSDITIFACPLLAINRLRFNINGSAYRLFNAGFFLVYFVVSTFIGPKYSMYVEEEVFPLS